MCLVSAQSELNKTVAAVATALRAVFIGVKSSVEVDRPQAGGYSILRNRPRIASLVARTRSGL
jgi:hypothetical protein